MNFPKLLPYIMAYYLDFIQLWYISLTFGFAFGFSKVYHKISVLLKWVKIFKFVLGNGKSWKSQYRIYLPCIELFNHRQIIVFEICIHGDVLYY